MKEQGVWSVRCGRMRKRREKEAVLGLKGDVGWGRASPAALLHGGKRL